jgi:hypothetical protein
METRMLLTFFFSSLKGNQVCHLYIFFIVRFLLISDLSSSSVLSFFFFTLTYLLFLNPIYYLSFVAEFIL